MTVMRITELGQFVHGIATCLILVLATAALGGEAQAQFFVRAEQVTFIPHTHIVPDDPGASYTGAPHWSDGDSDGAVTTVSPNPSSPIDRNFPIHYVGGDSVTVGSFTLQLLGVPPTVITSPILVQPTVKFLGLSIPLASVTGFYVIGTNTYSFPSTVATFPLPSGYVLALDPMLIEWKVTLLNVGHPSVPTFVRQLSTLSLLDEARSRL